MRNFSILILALIFQLSLVGQDCSVDNYCVFTPAFNPSDEYIDSVYVNNLALGSGASMDGYEDLTGAITFGLFQNSSNSCRLVPGFTNSSFDEYFRIWVDFNQDNIFDDNELVYDQGQTSQSAVDGSIFIPSSALLGNTVMRVIMQFNEPTVNPCMTDYERFGEIEDYCVNILPQQSCVALQEEEIAVTSKSDSICLNWKPILEVNSYVVEYRESGSTNWTEIMVQDTFASLTDFEECSFYEFRITVVCNNGDMVSSDIFEFKAGCDICSSPNYCNDFIFFNNTEWIDSLFFGDDSYHVGQNDAYNDFTGIKSFEANVRDSFDIRMVPGFAFDPFDEHYKIYVDYDHSETFEEDEVLFQSDLPSATGFAQRVAIPEEAMTGYTRMRVILSFGEILNACDGGGTSSSGEIEDYCLLISDPFPCDRTFEVEALDITGASATISWSPPVDSAIAYNVRYRADMEGEEFEVFATIDTFLNASELEFCTDYIAEVRAVCAIDTSSWRPVEFTTSCNTSTLDVIVNESIRISPNPFNQQFRINLESKSASTLRIDILDMSGKLINNRWVDVYTGENQIDFEGLEMLNSGVYFIRISDNKQSTVKKLIKT